MTRHLIAIVTLILMAAQSAFAGSLKIETWYAGPLTCTYGSGNFLSGRSQDIVIGYGRTWTFAAGANNIPTIDWLRCGDAIARNMAITGASQDHLIIIPDMPKRALNVLLYDYLPSAPNSNFESMQALVAENFAASGNPRVMLNAVITTDPLYDSYHPINYDRIFGTGGFDLVEVDTIMLPQILAGKYIRPWQDYDHAAFWAPATKAVTVRDTT